MTLQPMKDLKTYCQKSAESIQVNGVTHFSATTIIVRH